MLEQQEPKSIDEIHRLVRASERIGIIGHQTKNVVGPMATQDRNDPSKITNVVNMSGITGILQYDPSEFTITARAGTTLKELSDALAENGQFLPFDPPLIDQGATVGGMIASGISGPSRLRFGGIRDFVLGVRWVDGNGSLNTAGGKVVKNAAGFDIPKLMVGCWGELGILVEVTLKVFPQPAEYRTIRIETENLVESIELFNRLLRSPFEIDALDIDEDRSLLIRIGGSSDANRRSSERICDWIVPHDMAIMGVADELAKWTPLLDWTWCQDNENLVRVPLTTARIAILDAELSKWSVRRRYSVAGNLAWIAWPSTIDIVELDKTLESLALSGRIVRGRASQTICLGHRLKNIFAERVRQALDPDQRFVQRR